MGGKVIRIGMVKIGLANLASKLKMTLISLLK